MPSEKYEFIKAGVLFSFPPNVTRASTAALIALDDWMNKGGQFTRSFEKLLEESDRLEARLTWEEADSEAVPHLDAACDRAGTMALYLE